MPVATMVFYHLQFSAPSEARQIVRNLNHPSEAAFYVFNMPALFETNERQISFEKVEKISIAVLQQQKGVVRGGHNL
ncbi:MAG: hypothetical protein ABFD92_11000 [Planctomycetaceae bacterium]|nr:hypothetical protein [Planctomycetaceae bacterium]